MKRKRNLEITFSIILTLLVIIAAILLSNIFYADASEGGAAFSYTLCLTDSKGSEIDSISKLENGEKFKLDVILKRDDTEEKQYDDIWAYETGFTGYGLEFDADKAYKYVSQMTSKATEWSFDNTLTVEYLFMNYYPVGEKVKCYGVTTQNPQKTLSGTFTVTDKNKAQLALDIFIISLTEDFEADPTAHYVPVQKNLRLVLDAGGGKLSEDVSGIYDEGDIVTLPVPERKGYTFCGWKYSDEVYGKDETFEGTFTVPGGVCGTLEITPVWKLITSNDSRKESSISKGEDDSGKNKDQNDKESENQNNEESENQNDGGFEDADRYEAADETNVSIPYLNCKDHIIYLSGYPDNTVKPEGKLTRAELAAIYYRLLNDDVSENCTSKESSKRYIDISDNAWYSEQANVLTTLGILEGYPDNTFRGDRYITRAEFITAAVRFAVENDDTGNAGEDAGSNDTTGNVGESAGSNDAAENVGESAGTNDVTGNAGEDAVMTNVDEVKYEIYANGEDEAGCDMKTANLKSECDATEDIKKTKDIKKYKEIISQEEEKSSIVPNAQRKTSLEDISLRPVSLKEISLRDIDGNWAAASIKKSISYGWIKGYDDATFRPNSYITRAEAAVIINRILSRNTDRSTLDDPKIRTFSDCSRTDWYYNDIMSASNIVF